ncbi:hypothetical protein P0136_10580 [Lentisphaerota bacterium ZTH]|nr:hypothetical protein JYG24_11905 [Lentisphaerota bacterium]WET05806.1 hypothetical protein P0136_10580 [Lentisphaerota bacterium ZTH]
MRFPYYKNYPTEWLSGIIQNHDIVTKGIFNEIKEIYWQQDCQMQLLSICLARRCGIEKNVLENSLKILEKDDIIRIEDGFIRIKFLDDQFQKMSEMSQIRAQNGAKGGRVKSKAKQKVSKSQASAKQTLSKCQANANKLEVRIIKEKNLKKRSFDFQISPTLKKSNLPDDIQLKFIDWLQVYHAVHGKMHATSQDLQIRSLMAIPESRREQALDAAIRSQWKNIHDPEKKPQGERNYARAANCHFDANYDYSPVENGAF